MGAFLLGFSSGTVCLAYCAPVLVPFLLSEGRGVRTNVLLVGKFLSGRLIGYLVFAVFSWAVGQVLLRIAGYRETIFGGVYVLLSVLLVLYGFFDLRSRCAGKGASRSLDGFAGKWPSLLPLVLGFITGFNLCPPFLLALSGAAHSRGILDSVRFFALFFLGTAVYFIPMPILGVLKPLKPLRTVGRLVCGIIGCFYFYQGIIMIQGGIRHP